MLFLKLLINLIFLFLSVIPVLIALCLINIKFVKLFILQKTCVLFINFLLSNVSIFCFQLQKINSIKVFTNIAFELEETQQTRIESLSPNIIQLELFDTDVIEVKGEQDARYILRKTQ